MRQRILQLTEVWEEYKNRDDKTKTETLRKILADSVGFLLKECQRMTLNDYQTAAMAFAVYPKEHAIVYGALAVANEAGELAGEAKKMLRDDQSTLTPERLKAMKKEAGDTLWELAAHCHELGFTLEEVGKENLAKLTDRQKRGVLHGKGDNR